MRNSINKIGLFLGLMAIFLPHVLLAQTLNLNANALVPKVTIALSPRTASFEEGSTFEMPIILNTKGYKVNGVEVRINFDPNKLAVVKPGGGQSIIGVWVEPPFFDNIRGVVSYIGVIPEGITTGAGLIGTVTFKAKVSGKTTVNLSSNSKVLLHDGSGTEAITELGRAEYSIFPKAPKGVVVFSETHPFPGDWYNNKNPILSWEKEPAVSGFSFVLDNKPNTIPENIIKTANTSEAFSDLSDGLWYFHIKSQKNGVWGNTTDFLLRIDTTPPAEFTPVADYVLAAAGSSDKVLISFFTTDNLSGVNRYEVGVLDKKSPLTESPVFVETSGTFQLNSIGDSGMQVIVRAIDNAGNVRDASIDIERPNMFMKLIKDNLVYILFGIIVIAFVSLIFHYLFGHHILAHLKRAFNIIKEEERKNNDGPHL